jgi:hypothetical protein
VVEEASQAVGLGALLELAEEAGAVDGVGGLGGELAAEADRVGPIGGCSGW